MSMTEDSLDRVLANAAPKPNTSSFGRGLARWLHAVARRLDPDAEGLPSAPLLSPRAPSLPPPRPLSLPPAAAALADNAELMEKTLDLLESARQDVLERITGVNAVTEREALAAGSGLQAIVNESQTQVNDMRATLEQLGGSEGRVGVPQLAARQANAVRAYLERMMAIVEVHDGTVQASHASSERIAEIGRSVGKLAFQARLLSLNAAIEAARLGSSGGAFSVIADEMTRLSTETDAANRKIGELAESLLKFLPDLVAQTTEIRNTSAAFSDHMATELSDLEQTNGAFESRVKDALVVGDERIARVVAHSYDALSHLAFQDACAQRLLSVDAVLKQLAANLGRQFADPSASGDTDGYQQVQRNSQFHAGEVVALQEPGEQQEGGANSAGSVLLF